MKNPLHSLIPAACLALGMPLAQAAPEACHDQAQGAMHTQADGSMFGKADANGDGLLSRREFAAFENRRFKAMDANNDGKLSPEEMQGGHAQPPAGNMSGNGTMGNGTTHLDQRFNAADADHDGGLDRNEAQGMPMLTMYFDEVDANKNGKVTRQEYFDAMPLLHRAKQEKAESL